MKHLIRSYKKEDLNTISEWIYFYNNTLPPDNILMEDGTFILELNGIPALCLSVLLTQTKEMSYLFNFIKNPIFKDINMEEYGQLLWNHCTSFAKENGYKRILCFSDNDKLKNKYERFGMKQTVNGLSSFVMELINAS